MLNAELCHELSGQALLLFAVLSLGKKFTTFQGFISSLSYSIRSCQGRR